MKVLRASNHHRHINSIYNLFNSVNYKFFRFVEEDFSSCNLEPFLFFLLRGDGESVNSVIVFLFLGDAVSLYGEYLLSSDSCLFTALVKGFSLKQRDKISSPFQTNATFSQHLCCYQGRNQLFD